MGGGGKEFRLQRTRRIASLKLKILYLEVLKKLMEVNVNMFLIKCKTNKMHRSVDKHANCENVD